MASTPSTTDVSVTIVPDVDLSMARIQQARRRTRDSRKKVLQITLYFEGDPSNPPTRLDAQNNVPQVSEANLQRIMNSLLTLFPRVRHIRLEWNMMAAQYFEQQPLFPTSILRLLLSRGKHLQSLELYRLRLAGGPEDYQELLPVMRQNKTIKIVRLEFCKVMGTHNLDCAVSTLAKLSQLEELEVIGFNGCRDRVCSSESLEVLGSCPKLKVLKLWGGVYQTATENSVLALARGLQNNHPCLNEMEIGLFQLNVPSAQAIAQIIRNNTSLKRIWLDSSIQVTKEAFQPLMEALQHSTSVTNFSVVITSRRNLNITSTDNSQEDIDVQLLQMLVDTVKNNYTMRHCTLRTGGEPNEQLQAELDMYLKLNRIGRKQLLEDNAGEWHGWISALSAERENTSVIYYLLRQNPAFISQCGRDTRKRVREIESNMDVELGTPAPKRRRLAAVVSPLTKWY